MKKAAGYIRVSTEEQANKGYSLAAQEDLLRRYASEHDMEIVEVYADEGISAAKSLDKRAALLRLLADAEKGRFSVVLFKDITRWTRNAAAYYRCQEKLDRSGVGWIAVEQPYLETVTPTGRFQVNVMLGTSQLEAEQTGQRIKFVQDSQISMGYFPFPDNNAPRGYKSERQQDGHMKLVVDPEQKQVIETIFKLFLQTFNYTKVSQIMRERGYNIPPVSITKIIRHPIYKGEFRGIEGFCEPIISAEKWEACQIARRPYSAGKHRGEYIFSKLIICQECGKIMRGFCPEDKYHAYQCRVCKRTISQKKVESILLDQLAPALDKYKMVIKERAGNEKRNAENRKKIADKKKRLVDLYVDSLIEKTEFEKRKAELDRQMEALAPSPEIPKLSTNWRKLYDNLSNEKKSALWRSFSDHIELDRNNNATIAFYSAKVLADRMAKFNV